MSKIALDGELTRASTITLCQVQTSSPTPLTWRSSSNDPMFRQKLREPREDFRTKLSERDGRCVWTGFTMPIGMHVIPHRRGDEACSLYSCPSMRAKFSILLLQWLRCIIDNRPHDENLGTLTTINDIRNGICAIEILHNQLFDPRLVVVLKVCPPISSERPPLNTTSDAKSYPPNHRYSI
jgi:hypothetical protein